MALYDELTLLVRSRYPIVFVESVDEQYVVSQLFDTAKHLNMVCYEWSATSGMRRTMLKDPYPDTSSPSQALRMILDVKKSSMSTDQMFILKDFNRYFDEPMHLRLLQDIVSLIRGSRTTIVIVGTKYNLPPEFEPVSAYFIGGYPTQNEIIDCINETIAEFHRENSEVGILLSDTDQQRLVRILRGLTLQQIRNLMSRCIVEKIAIDRSSLSQLEQMKKRIYDKDGLLEFCATEKMSHIAGFPNLKKWISARKNSFYHRDGSLPAPKGLLLMGIQGCGKSIAVKAIAAELSLPLYRLDIIKFYSKYIGETEQNLRKALGTIDRIAPICLWIDEIEKNFASSGGDIDGGVSQRLLGTFLTWMQERTCECFVCATANDIESLSPEFLRKGRFDEIFFVDLPNRDMRKQLLLIHLEKRNLKIPETDIEELVSITESFSGAEIEQAMISALYRAGGRAEKTTIDHLIEEIKNTRPLAVVKKEDIDSLRKWSKDRTVQA